MGEWQPACFQKCTDKYGKSLLNHFILNQGSPMTRILQRPGDQDSTALALVPQHKKLSQATGWMMGMLH
tara:strand:+ start:511 stop:717 length:207 start_codon:yes stop_codon:yes gene_type:complete